MCGTYSTLKTNEGKITCARISRAIDTKIYLPAHAANLLNSYFGDLYNGETIHPELIQHAVDYLDKGITGYACDSSDDCYTGFNCVTPFYGEQSFCALANNEITDNYQYKERDYIKSYEMKKKIAGHICKTIPSSSEEWIFDNDEYFLAEIETCPIGEYLLTSSNIEEHDFEFRCITTTKQIIEGDLFFGSDSAVDYCTLPKFRFDLTNDLENLEGNKKGYICCNDKIFEGEQNWDCGPCTSGNDCAQGIYQFFLERKGYEECEAYTISGDEENTYPVIVSMFNEKPKYWYYWQME
jgi:hypothetical protein